MYITIILLLIVLISFIIHEKSLSNPSVIFSAIWVISLVLSSLGLFGMIEITTKAKFLLGMGVISFIIGTILIYLYYVKKNNTKKEEVEGTCYQEEINFKFVNVILLIGIIFIIPVAIKVTWLLFNGVDYSNIRSMYYSYGSIEPLIKNETFFTIFDWSLAIILSSTTSIIITGISNKKLNKLSLIQLAVLTILYIYTTAGRSQLFIIVIEIVLIYLINPKMINKKIVSNVKKIVISLMVIVAIMTIARSTSKGGIVRQAYSYLSLPEPYFSELVKYVDNEEIHTNGIATFYGPYLLVQKTIKGLINYKLPLANYYANIINKPQNYWINVYKDSKDCYNAYGTMFYYFYLDFGFLGVIFISMLYGILMEKVYINAKYKKGIYRQVAYLLLISGLCTSFIRWQFASPTILISLVLTKLFIKKQKNIKENAKTNKILVFGITDNPGGIETVIMNYYRQIDKNKIQFDFLCNTQEVAYEDELKQTGASIYKITPRSKNKIKYTKDMKKFFSQKSCEYSAIWVNVCSLANIDYLKYAKKYGIPKRIIHCHNSQNMDSKLRGMLHLINKQFIDIYATNFWTCSNDSNKWFYPKRLINKNKIKIIKNAIDVSDYKFDKDVRDKYRKMLDLENKLVIGNVGRLHFQKNQTFLIDIFYEISKEEKNSILLLIGQGEDEQSLKNKIKELDLEEKVKILGSRNDVSKILQAMDIFVFPSIFEGWGIALIEAQAAGLKAFASSNVIPYETKMSDNFEFISLNESAKEWAKKIIENKNYDRVENMTQCIKQIQEKGYDVKIEARKFQSFFE